MRWIAQVFDSVLQGRFLGVFRYNDVRDDQPAELDELPLADVEEESGGLNETIEIQEEVVGVYPRIMQDGEVDAGAFSCGMVAGLISDIPSCKDLVERIVNEAEEIIHNRLAALAS